jgi:hypothetical protein
MNPRGCWALGLLCWMTVPLAAAPQPAEPTDCFTNVRIDPEGATRRDLITVTIDGLRDPCDRPRVAAIGDAETLGQPFDHELNLVVAIRDHALPSGVCPETGPTPYQLTAHLPETLAQNNPHDGPHQIGMFLRREDASGKLLSLQECGEVGVYIEPGTRSIAMLHQGRFWVSVTWRVPARSGIGWVVPDSNEPPVDAALFWFFAPENWELLVKVLDGCSLNGHWWVIGAAATDVEFGVFVQDTVTGQVWIHRNAPGVLAPAFADVKAFDGCAATSQ